MIRTYTPSDLARLHAINEASTPNVSKETERSLAACFAAGICLVAVDADDSPIGFLSLVEPGADYRSPNYAWFEARGGDYVYVDRIAFSPETRGQGLGPKLYEKAFERFAGRRSVMVCEINTLPPNPGSMRFHERLGFRVVGHAAHDPGVYEVAFLERSL